MNAAQHQAQHAASPFSTVSSTPRSALLMAAGTGGHIMPGLAICTELQSRNWTVQWLGTAHGMENTLVPAAGIVLNKLQFAGLRGKGAWGLMRGAWQLLFAFKDAFTTLRRVKPTVVIGMGGYVCVPGAWAARVLGIPVVLVNADADLLLSNRSLAPFATTVCCGFAGNAAQLKNAVVTGNPIRASVANIVAPEQRLVSLKAQSKALNVLIVGGSLGAQVLNDTVPAALALWARAAAQTLTVSVQHQTGVKQVQQVQAAYDAQQVAAQVFPFIDDMAAAYAWADVVICRAGAVTVSELCAAGVPAIVVPLLAQTTTHQAGNAQYLAQAGAGIYLPQAQFSAQTLLDTLLGLGANLPTIRTSLLAMAQRAKALGKPQATQSVVSQIEKAAP